MSDTHRMKFATDQFYFKTAKEMAEVFREVPDAVSRTVDVAARCNVKIEHFPNALPEFKVPAGHTPAATSKRWLAKVLPNVFLTLSVSPPRVSCATRYPSTKRVCPLKSK